jgi:methionine-rich copper-binding protein CopC
MFARRSLLAACAVPVFARGASAHSRLLESRPRAGETLASDPGEFVLRFDEGAVLTSLRLFGPAGAEVTLTRARDAIPAAVWRARHPALTPGAHRLDWRALSADGHPIGGSITFTVRG